MMTNNPHFVWAEKYRPTSLEDCILPKHVYEMASGYVKSGKIPHLTFHGSAGTGKTTLARVLCKELNYEYKIINGSNEGRLIDTLRNEITQFASTVSFEGKRKCLIIDEADFMPDLVQGALRNFIDEYSKNCSFILTCNFPNKLMEAIHSRCPDVDFNVSVDEHKDLMKAVLKRVFNILKDENIDYEPTTVATLVKATYPDIRKLLNRLQKYAARGKIDSGVFTSDESELDSLIKALKSSSWSDMRSWVARQGNIDFVDFCRKLYDRLEPLVSPSCLPLIVMAIGDYQYKSHFVGDKEINTTCFLTQIMSDVTFK